MCVTLLTSDKTDFNPKEREKSLHTDEGAIYDLNVCTELVIATNYNKYY